MGVCGGELLWLLLKLRFPDESLPPQGLDAPTTIVAPLPSLLEPLKLNQLWLHRLLWLAPTSWLWAGAEAARGVGKGNGRGCHVHRCPSEVPLVWFVHSLNLSFLWSFLNSSFSQLVYFLNSHVTNLGLANQ